jgi:serine O-acetyltransferase
MEMKYSETLKLIKTDILEFASRNDLEVTFLRKISIGLMPCVLSISLYRISHYFYSNDCKLFARFFWTLNLVLFASDIAPYTEIGESFYMPHTTGTIIAGKLGKKVVVFARAGIGGKPEVDKGLHGTEGFPVIGDNVIVGAGSMVLGHIKIGNNVTIGACSLIREDIPENATVVTASPKIRILNSKNENSD